MSKTRQMTTLAMCIALAVVFHTIEGQIPIPSPVPGYHLGLSNIVGLVVLYKFDSKNMVYVNFLRVLFVSFLNGTFMNYPFWLSVGGVTLSTIAAILMKKGTGLSVIGVSVACAVAHCVGQILMALYFYNQPLLITYLPFLLFTSIPTGILTGTITSLVLKRLKV